MKRSMRVLSLVAALVLLPLQFSFAETVPAPAESLAVTYYDSDRNKAKAEQFTDANDETGLALPRAETAEMSLQLPDSAACQSVYIRLNVSTAAATLQQYNADTKKYTDVQTLNNPGGEFIFKLAQPLSGRLRIQFTFSKAVRCRVLELQAFSPGVLPETIHDWSLDRSEVDVLLAFDTLESIDAGLIRSLVDGGYRVGVSVMNSDDQSPGPICDALWNAGVRILPAIATTGKKTAELLSWIRMFHPMLLATDAALSAIEADAVAQASDYFQEIDSAVLYGLWITPDSCTVSDDVLARAAAIGTRSDDALMQMCVDRFADAQSADTATIPYPEGRDANGYLPEGEFVYENPEDGLWAYLSDSIQIQIVRYKQPDVPALWYEADLIFDPAKQSFKQYIDPNAHYKGEWEEVSALAQSIKLVFGINGDYYQARINDGFPSGITIRDYKLIYSLERPWIGFPPLDTLALRDDGSFNLYTQGEITGDELIAQGDVHDAMSFGPILVRDNVLQMYGRKNWEQAEPRMAIGMYAPGHYRIVMVEGKMPGKGEQGFDVNEMAEYMYSRGVSDAMNIDGGSTAVMLFMGVRLNRTGKGTFVGSPREQNELFGLGYSEAVHGK
jgi:hypothetical protein